MPSEDGWEPARVGQDAVEWVTVPGTTVKLQLMKGWPLAILRAFAADYNAFVEPLRDPDSASWTPTNSVPTSNHLNGTAMDLNWNSHPFRVKGTFSAAQMTVIRELLAFYEGTVFWAGDWANPIDEMHWQMGYGTYRNPKVGDVIARKIRADGFSTFRRGGGAPVVPDPAGVLASATGLARPEAERILPQVLDGLAAAGCTTVRRVAMWLAQIGHESDSFRATEEYANGDESTDRWRYKGRTWIQITWQTNYAGFSKWAHGRGLVPTATYFVDRPKELAQQNWAGLGAAWYWTVARPQINALCDAGDLNAVTRAINGGTNGLADRRARYDRALALGDRLLTLTTSTKPTPPKEGFLMALTDSEQREVLDLLRQQNAYRRVSRSPLRRVGERETETISGFAWNTDGSVHVLLVNLLARLGDPDALALLNEVAALNPSQHPDRARDRLLAQAILNSLDGTTAVESAPPTGELPGTVELPPVYQAPVYAEPVFHPAPVAPYSFNESVQPVAPGDGVRTATATLGTAITEIRDMLNTYTEQLRS